MGRKVTLSLYIRSESSIYEEIFDIEEDLGFVEGEDYDTEDGLEELLEDYWIDWKNERVGGEVKLENK